MLAKPPKNNVFDYFGDLFHQQFKLVDLIDLIAYFGTVHLLTFVIYHGNQPNVSIPYIDGYGKGAIVPNGL